MLTIFKGKNGKYGVEEKGKNGFSALQYEADFKEATAQRIADLENSGFPPRDWEATKERQLKEGFKI